MYCHSGALSTVFLWDEVKQAAVGEINLPKGRKVRGLDGTGKYVLVLSERTASVFVLGSKEIKRIDVNITFSNPAGCGRLFVGFSEEEPVIAIPGMRSGTVMIHKFASSKGAIAKSCPIEAHKHDIDAIELGKSGKWVVTASVNGTMIRLFDCDEGSLLCEFKRGSSQCRISSLSMHQSGKWLACTSDLSTVHVFAVPISLFPEDKGDNDKRHGFSGSRAWLKMAREFDSHTSMVAITSSLKFNIAGAGGQGCRFSEDDPDLLYVICSLGNLFLVSLSEDQSLTSQWFHCFDYSREE